jgi:hypothetical protein
MITKEQAMSLPYGASVIHYTGRHQCQRIVGPRGGVTVNITSCRASGQCKTWKTRPSEFKLPIKHGLYESSYITHENAGDFHLASECPLETTS